MALGATQHLAGPAPRTPSRVHLTDTIVEHSLLANLCAMLHVPLLDVSSHAYHFVNMDGYHDSTACRLHSILDQCNQRPTLHNRRLQHRCYAWLTDKHRVLASRVDSSSPTEAEQPPKHPGIARQVDCFLALEMAAWCHGARKMLFLVSSLSTEGFRNKMHKSLWKFSSLSFRQYNLRNREIKIFRLMAL